MGHEQKSCKRSKVMSSYNLAIPKYGHGFGDPSAKPLMKVLKEQLRRNGSLSSEHKNDHETPTHLDPNDVPRDALLGNDFSHVNVNEALNHRLPSRDTERDDMVVNCSVNSILKKFSSAAENVNRVESSRPESLGQNQFPYIGVTLASNSMGVPSLSIIACKEAMEAERM